MSKKGISMINPPLIDLLQKVDNRYSLIIVAARRARQIIDGDKPLLDTDSNKPVTIAINEINNDMITVEEGKEGIK
ncbi:DNA-directed RNA polymerase subunit omega [Haloimpatiens lingqiaonensis]|uniref:DNA-directed RNA polymerase subunit omega n=1 Tax=Haloimpatiens lingqiaonensis TaxID=1380675 RepID=UPI001FAAE3D0|nr:DNA-directed RNA polymerase subunit omega [Haloimpatiens lingqiaonensis]